MAASVDDALGLFPWNGHQARSRDCQGAAIHKSVVAAASATILAHSSVYTALGP